MEETKVRINRFLSSCGLGSRRECERYVVNGRVTLNGKPVLSLSEKVDPEKDTVLLNDKQIRPIEKQLYLLLNKPLGYVVSRDGQALKSVFELLPGLPRNLAYAGRLDADSEGLLFLTTDGEVINRLAHPRYEECKVYLALLDRDLSVEQLGRFRQGLGLEDRMTRPAQIDKVLGEVPHLYRVMLKEGRNRQIRRMIGLIGAQVRGLRRVAFGGLTLGNLKSGAWRHLSANEVWKLKRDLKLSLKKA